MKDSELHNGLELSELRDGIARSLISRLHTNQRGEEERFPFSGTKYEKILYNIKKANAAIEYQKEIIDRETLIMGMFSLMDFYGWEEWDLSEYVSKTGKFYLSFIGSKEECAALCVANHFDIKID